MPACHLSNIRSITDRRVLMPPGLVAAVRRRAVYRQGMNPTRASSMFDEISLSIQFLTINGWSLDWQEGDRAQSWVLELGGRLLILIGDDSVEYSSGYLQSVEPDDAAGEVVVFTTRAIICASFTANKPASGSFDRQLDATVTAYPRDSVRSVSIARAGGFGTSAWPKAIQITVNLDDRSITLPLRVGYGVEDTKLAKFAEVLLP